MGRVRTGSISVLLAIVITMIPAGLLAVSANPEPVKVTQPDQTEITIRLFGDEWHHYAETTDGYTIVRNNDGWWNYASKNSAGELVSTSVNVHPVGQRSASEQNYLSNTQKHIRANQDVVEQKRARYSLKQVSRQEVRSLTSRAGDEPAVQTTNDVLLLLIEYPDLASTETVQSFDDMMNQSGYTGGYGATGSFNDYFEEVSYGQFGINGSANGWYQAANNYTYYGDKNGSARAAELVREAVDAAENAGVDFSQYDNDGDGEVDGLFIVHSGPGAEESGNTDYIWSHKWNLAASGSTRNYDGVLIDSYTIQPEKQFGRHTGIGVYCHEYGHAIGLPDLYDTNGGSEGIGEWGVMGSGGWLNSGLTPSHLSPWSKEHLGWVNPQEITSNNTYTFNAVESDSSAFYKVDIPTDKSEYFLLENRQNSMFDDYLPGDGMLIWHIDTDKTSLYPGSNDVNADETHKGVDVEAADGAEDMDQEVNRGDLGDPFPGSTANTVFDANSNPNTDDYSGISNIISVSQISSSSSSMSALVEVNIPVTEPEIAVSPDSFDVTLTSGLSTTNTMTIDNSGDGDLSYNISLTSSSSPVSENHIPLSSVEHTTGGAEDSNTPSLYSKISFTVGDTINSIPLPSGVEENGLAWDGSNVWITDFNNDQIHKLDPDNGTILQSFGVPGAGSPSELAWDGQYLWHADFGTEEIYRIDPSTGSVVSQFSMPAVAEGLTWDGSHLWFVDSGDFYKMDTTGMTVQQFGNNTGYEDGLAWINGSLWVATNGAAAEVDPATGNVQNQISFSFSLTDGLAFDGKYMLVADDDAGRLYQIDIGGPGWLSVSPTSGTVVPSSSENLDVITDAEGLTAGNYSATIHVNSNDTNEATIDVPVDLTVNAPDIAVTPDSFDVTLDVGDSTEKTLTIDNLGGGDLFWEIIAQGILPSSMYPGEIRTVYQETDRSSDQTGQGGITEGTPAAGTSQLNYRTSETSGPDKTHQNIQILVLSNDDVDNNWIKSNFPNYISGISIQTYNVSSNVPSLSYLHSFDAVLLFENVTFSNSTAVGDRIYDYVMAGGNVVLGTFYWQGRSDGGYSSDWGQLENIDPLFGGSADYISGEMDTTNIVSHPLTTGLTSLTASDFQGGPTQLRSNATAVAWWQDGDPLLAYNKPGGLITAVTIYPTHPANGTVTGDFYLLWENALKFTGGAAQTSWLTAVPDTGTVASSGSQNVTVKIDATGLSGGLHEGELSVNSNDPDENPLNVPVDLNVNGPRANVYPDQLVASLASGDTVTQTFVIKNDGNRTLDYTVTDTTLSIPAQFSPGSIDDDDNSTNGSSQEPSGGLQSSQNSALKQGDRTLSGKLSNQETSAEDAKSPESFQRDRNGATSSLDWLTISPQSGSVAPGDSAVINAQFSAGGNQPGTYEGSILVSTNDPGNPEINVKAKMNIQRENFTTEDNENNQLEGIPDGDMDTYLYNDDPIAPIEFNIFVADTDSVDTAQLNLLAYDIDETSGEVDSVLFNGTHVGMLTGADDIWSTSVFNLDPSLVQEGANLVQIYIDIDNPVSSNWATTVDWGQVVLNGGDSTNASIRYAQLDTNSYMPGDSVKVQEEIDTDLSSQSVRIETNLLNPSGVNLAGKVRYRSLNGSEDDPFTESLMVPTDAELGEYTLQVIVYDSLSYLQEDIVTKPFGVTLPTPVNVVAGDGYSGIVPLTWDENPEVISSPASAPSKSGVSSDGNNAGTQSSETVSLTFERYKVYRSTTSGGPYTLVDSLNPRTRNYADNQDYVDTGVTNGQTYYYVVTAVYADGETDYSKEVMATPSQTGHVINSAYSSGPPTLDGVINSSEYTNATQMDIATPGASQSVDLYVKNDQDYLYLAIDNPNNSDTSGTDEIGLYFDSDHNRTWDPDSLTDEGNFWIDEDKLSTRVRFRGLYGNHPDSLRFTDVVESPSGIDAALSQSSGHLQYEIALDLNSSYLVDAGDSLGIMLFEIDADHQNNYHYGFAADWPQGHIWAAPESYGSIVLSRKVVTEIPLNSTWNLVSWNVDSEQDSTRKVLDPILGNLDVALGFDNGGLTFDPALSTSTNTLDSVDHRHGYWLRIDSEDTLTVEGPPVSPQTALPLDKGWNTVSYLPTNADSLRNGFQSIMDNLVVALGYNGGGLTFDPSLPDYLNTLNTVKPQSGYWVKLDTADTLVYPQNQAATGPQLLADQSVSVSEKSQVTPTNSWMGLYAKDMTVDGQPIAVGTQVHAIDKDGVICGETTVKRKGTFGIMPIYKDDPATKVDEGAEPGEAVTIRFGDYKSPVTVEWSEFGDIMDYNQVVTSTGKELRSLPDKYDITQNYPNPFNPETQIDYQLPEESNVTIAVYDLLGQKVATLKNGNQKAGYYSVKWNGTNDRGQKLSSGVYFYQIRAGDFQKTRKMLFLK
ncbi:MAG: M6 family metalloprotease domain-containing protein [Candidatus Marinimicrobia bacterium]|nr:M6 family metalloprotease domain-containing protein [Candidatus Neomarinimicrobiota bacterium]MCF7829593.1 M6 family metalloprotease domain-containing protein [Candidatus Neomarinimicrobiota bacterium]MCF7882247.1 M6 family metalloprotease domain-containing protein [Candidatus Neomarinimicrobiota bacterium]